VHGRLLALVAMLLALAALGATPASATTTVTTTVSNNVSGTSDHPRGVSIGAGLSSTTPFPQAAAASVTSVRVTLSDYTVIDSAADQACALTQVYADEAQCPVGSQVGDGTMDLQVQGAPEHLTLKVFKDGPQLYVLYVGQAPLGLRGVGLGSITNGTLAFSVPSNVASPNGSPARFTAVSLRLGLPRPGSAGWIFTTACTPVSYDVGVEVDGSDASALQGSARARCFPGSYVAPALTVDDATAGTPAAPRPAGATISLGATPAFPAPWIGQMTSLTLTFGEGVALGASATAPSCTAQQVGADDGACPPGSRVGVGTMSEGGTIALTAYNAPGGRGLNVLATAPSRYVIAATLDPTSRTLTLPIPAGIAQPQSGYWYGLSAFTLSLGDKTAGSWFKTVGCAGTWDVTTYLDGGGGVEQATGSTPCSSAPPAPAPGGGDGSPIGGANPGGPTPVPGAKTPAGGASVPSGILPRFLPTFVTSARRHGKLLGYFHGVAGLDEVPVGASVDVLCVRGCRSRHTFSPRKALKKNSQLLLPKPVAVTARTIVEIRERRGSATGRSARFIFQRVHALLLAHRIASGCVVSRPPVAATQCVGAA
jgi:hypothetical protein